MRLGIVGCGWIVEREHAPALHDARGVDVVAVADIAHERARLVGTALGLEERDCLDDPRRLIERSDIDAVSIATPPNVRTELVAMAAASGKHVVCEKPLATTLAAADEMIEVLRACGRAPVRVPQLPVLPRDQARPPADRAKARSEKCSRPRSLASALARGRARKPSRPAGAALSATPAVAP